MANYLPVLLVSVTAGMPDDAALQPLPRGQVDYLSHDWAEEDVWRSWRSMTKQKNEIANGVRLENASWRTWMKQRNKLKTISPETLNWLKDSDVTWLYGPLHTAVDWTPPPKPAISPPVMQRGKDDTSAPSPKSPGANSLSSPSSTVHLDHFNPPAGRYSTPSHSQDGSNSMKPILKHRSIAEMLTSALPPAPAWAEEHAEYEGDFKHQGEWMADGSEGRTQQERRDSSTSGKGGRPSLAHTKSDTNILPRFGHGRGGAPKKAHISPPRVAPAAEDRAPRSPSQPHSGSLSADQRTGASNNLAELAIAQAPSSPYWKAAALENTESRASSTFTSDTANSGRAESDASGLCSAVALPPQRKHISFNAIVEQCIAIDGGSDSITPSTQGPEWMTYEDDGYTQNAEDGLFEDVSPGLHGDSDSDDACVDEEDEILEIKPPSRRSSSSSLQEYQAAVEARQTDQKHDSPPILPRRPQFRRSSTGSSRLGRSRKSASTSAGSTSGSGSNSGRTSESGRSRSSTALDREHVSIAPIAPTILKAGEAEDTEDGVLYIGSAPYAGYSASPNAAHGSSNGGLYATYTGSGYGYGYGGYGYGERVSAGRDDAYENFERGNEAGEIVYQSPNGNVYPWGDADAMRFRMQSEYSLLEPLPQGYAPHSPPQSFVHQPGLANSSMKEDGTARFIPGPLVREPNFGGAADEPEFEYFDTMEGAHRVEAMDGERSASNEDRRVGADFVAQRYVGATGNVDQQSPQLLDSGSLQERTPSPDFLGKINPRIASLKSEGGYRSPPPASSHGSDVTVSPAPSSPTRAIPTPRISSAHLQDHTRMRSPPDSPTMHAGLLSPPDMSPRGRSTCVSPVSGSATSSSIARSGSRSTSEERSDSRGRSRTRNSSLASSPEQGDPERGRSRSRSNNSPLSDNSSPHTRSPSYSIGGIGIGLGIGGGFGPQHVGREVRDGHGVPLYRKTSEDSIRGGHSEGRTAHSDVRGRNRDGKRISESLSPPVLGSIPAERRSGLSPPTTSGTYRPIPSAGAKSHFARTSGTMISGDNGTDKDSSLGAVPVAGSAEAKRPISSRRSDSSRSGSREHSETASTDSTSSHFGSIYSTAIATGRTLPPSIPEEDEQRLRVERPTSMRGGAQSQDSSQPTSRTNSLPARELRTGHEPSVNGSSRIATSSSAASASEQRSNAELKTATHSSESRTPSQTFSGRNKADGASDGAGKVFADRTAELMSSARSLLGTIWNSS